MFEKIRLLSGMASPINIIKVEHRKIEGLFAKFAKASSVQKAKIGAWILKELGDHIELEKEFFYDALENKESEEAYDLEESYQNHKEMKDLISDLENIDPGDEEYGEKILILRELAEDHVEMEESSLFPFAEENFDDDEKKSLAEDMKKFKAKLQ